jgi:hypothetical protein
MHDPQTCIFGFRRVELVEVHVAIDVIIIITGRRFQANLPLAWETKREENSTRDVVGN